MRTVNIKGLVIFKIKFTVIQGYLPHFNEIFRGHVHNIHHWEFQFLYSPLQ